MDKSEALRLADAIERAIRPEASLPVADWARAAAELRRLHAENASLAAALAQPEGGGNLPPPLQPEPVAVVGTQVDVWRGCDGRWAPPGEPIKMVHMLKDLPLGTLLYTAPPQQPKPEPEPCAMRYGYDGYGYLYIDAGSGSDWRTRVKSAEPLYTAPPKQSAPEPAPEPAAYRFQSPVGGWAYGSQPPLGSKYPAHPLYAAPPQRKPLTLTDLQEALVLTNLIDRDAIEDPNEYDKGSTLAQIDALHRIIKEDK